ncbi:DUF1440 domain-containing protein [Kribbella pittospori]|uniref:DUF1440 domain-containing protein n=1 Tax=Kribbella pittospori TaxID=722689 RepID=A0A4R0JFY1_9ACTN|nr:DUF1440 domain-containing protein [Kribbella pittospori]TCC45369.1 DUF1440 domain-containing protein [Kribbella pittospori]
MLKGNAKQAGRTPMTPLGAVIRGSAAAAVGTLAMDVLLYGRYRKEAGKSGFPRWEFSADVHNWDEAPAPAQVGKRLFEGLFRRELPDRRAALVNNVMHWGFGILNGAVYGVLAGSVPEPKVRHGALFGAGVWASGYVTLPAAGLYEPIWKYDGRVLAKDLSAHLVYGLTTATAFRILDYVRKPRK